MHYLFTRHPSPEPAVIFAHKIVFSSYPQTSGLANHGNLQGSKLFEIIGHSQLSLLARGI